MIQFLKRLAHRLNEEALQKGAWSSLLNGALAACLFRERHMPTEAKLVEFIKVSICCIRHAALPQVAHNDRPN